jgi:hypothetical protein
MLQVAKSHQGSFVEVSRAAPILTLAEALPNGYLRNGFDKETYRRLGHFCTGQVGSRKHGFSS